MRRAALMVAIGLVALPGARADESIPARLIPPGAALTLRRPRVLPCTRFYSFKTEVTHSSGLAAVTWQAGQRVVRLPSSPGFTANFFAPQLLEEELPSVARLVAGGPTASVEINLYCQKVREPQPYDDGISWLCGGQGCQPEAVYTVGRGKTRVEHLRLCAVKERCAKGWRDIGAAFVDRDQALALARAVVADAAATATHVCVGNPACAPAVLALRGPIGAALAERWTVVSHVRTPARGDGEEAFELRAAGGPFSVLLACGRSSSCRAELSQKGETLIYYSPVSDPFEADQRLEFAGGDLFTSLSESDARSDRESASWCMLRGAALSLR